MPRCIHCLYPLTSLTTHYGPNSFSLTPCQAPTHHSDCKSISNSADPYVEQNFVTVLLDLLLAKPQAFAHFLYNLQSDSDSDSQDDEEGERRKGTSKTKDDIQKVKRREKFGDVASTLRRWLAFLLIQSYIRWFYLCAHDSASNKKVISSGALEPSSDVTSATLNGSSDHSPTSSSDSLGSPSNSTSILPLEQMITSYTTILGSTALESLALHLTVLILYSVFLFIYKKRFIFESKQMKIESKQTKIESKPPNKSVSKSSIDTSVADINSSSSSGEKNQNLQDRYPNLNIKVNKTSSIQIWSYDPILIPKALLLSSISSIFLNSLILLWESKFPRNSRPSLTLDSNGGSNSLEGLQLFNILSSRIILPIINLFSTDLESFHILDSIQRFQSKGFNPTNPIHIEFFLGGISSLIAINAILPRTRLGFLPAFIILMVGIGIKSLVGDWIGISNQNEKNHWVCVSA